MTNPALYDWRPALQMGLGGLAIASVPLAWWWWRQRGRTPQARWQALLLLTLFLTFDLVVFGAFTRLTDSGLGCPDWPGCYGHASPVGAQAQIAAAQAAQPTGPVTHGKAWVEMIHRYLATGVGALILLTLLAALWQRWRAVGARPVLSWPWALLTLLWVCLQGAFGAWTVTLKLYPLVVTGHLLGGMGLLALLAVQTERLATTSVAAPLGRSTRWAVWLALGLLWIQISLGAWVSTNYAVLACTEFPACQGSWWPEMNFSEGFSLLRELGRQSDGGWLTQEALVAIHMAHRWAAYLVLTVLAALAWALSRLPVEAWRRAGLTLAALVVWQFLSGLSNVVLGWPLVAALGHTAGAAALVVTLTRLACRNARARAEFV